MSAPDLTDALPDLAPLPDAARDWFAKAAPELAAAGAAWGTGNAGKGRVGSRRAAGMALKGWLTVAPDDDFGVNFMHHLHALADAEGADMGVREAAGRLAARPRPEGGFQIRVGPELTPMADATAIARWAAEEALRAIAPRS